MIAQVDGRTVFFGTGGRPFDPAMPAIVMIHGAGMKRTVWRTQARYLAHHGYSVAAVDLPGHGRSAGPLLDSIGGMAAWLARFLDAAEIAQAALVGHSMGALVGLHAAAEQPVRITKLALLGAGDSMPVHPELLAAADAGQHRAFDLVTSWSLGRPAQIGGHPDPGAWMTGGLLKLHEEERPEVLAADLHACDNYTEAITQAAQVTCPVLVVVGSEDRMTPPSGALRLVDALTDATVVELDTGHSLMMEDPAGTVSALAGFFGSSQ